MSKIATGIHCFASAVSGFIRGIITMPLKFAKELDSYSSKPFAPSTHKERLRFTTRINKKISNGILPRLIKAISVTLIHPFVSVINNVKAVLKSKKTNRIASHKNSISNSQKPADDYLLDNLTWEQMHEETPSLETSLWKKLWHGLRLSFMFTTGFTYSFIRLPVAVLSDVIKKLREENFFIWLTKIPYHLIVSVGMTVFNTTRNWIKDEKELFWQEHKSEKMGKKKDFPEYGSASLYFAGLIAGLIVSPLYAVYFAFLKSPEHHHNHHHETFFQTLFKSPFRFLKALFDFPFDIAVRLAVINYDSNSNLPSNKRTPKTRAHQIATRSSDLGPSQTIQPIIIPRNEGMSNGNWPAIYYSEHRSQSAGSSLTPNPAQQTDRVTGRGWGLG